MRGDHRSYGVDRPISDSIDFKTVSNASGDRSVSPAMIMFKNGLFQEVGAFSGKIASVSNTMETELLRKQRVVIKLAAVLKLFIRLPKLEPRLIYSIATPF